MNEIFGYCGCRPARGIMSFREVSTFASDATSIEWSSASAKKNFRKGLTSRSERGIIKTQ